MTIRYAIRQSTDEDAFDELPPDSPSSPSLPHHRPNPFIKKATDRPFGTQSDPTRMPVTAKDAAITRKAAMEGLQERVQSKAGGGKLKGKVGIITGVGPSTGIGTATAKIMAREGAKALYLLDFDDTHLKPLAEQLRKDFPSTKFTTVRADAASSEAISSLVAKALKEEGHLDFFFANAGISQVRAKAGDNDGMDALKRLTRLAAEISDEEYMEIMRVNALSVFVAIKHAAPALAKACPEKGKKVPGGSLVLTASIAGLKANAGPLPYSASKAAVASMAQTASYELSGQNIRVNAVCPGLIQTDMTKWMFDLAKMGGKEDRMGSLNPLLRQGLGHEVGQLATFLASDESSYVNGQTIAVDGGLTAGVPYTSFTRAKL